MGMARVVSAVVVICLAAGVALAADEAKTVTLPKPQMEGGKPLMQALKDRHSSREFAPKKLPDQVLSNLLWAADGVNRADGKRTAPSAVNWQEVDIYVVMADGAFLYDAAKNELKPVASEDLRALTGQQDFVKEAPLNLVFVADLAKIKSSRPVDDKAKDMFTAADTGFISQNVYLFCASEGLNTVVRAMMPKEELGAKLKLRPEQRIILAQTVGYPKEMAQPQR